MAVLITPPPQVPTPVWRPKTQPKPSLKIDPYYSRLNSLRNRSKKKGWGLPDITIDDIKRISQEPCVYCDYRGNNQLDRKDNDVGYVLSNLVPACKRCNTVKSMYLTYDEMLVVAKALGWWRG